MITITDPETGRVLGDKDACAEAAGITPEAFSTYQRNKIKHTNNPVPQPVRRDLITGRYLTDIEAVKAWAAARPRGPGVGGRPRKEES